MIKLKWKKNKNCPSETIARGINGYACHIVHYNLESGHEYCFALMFNGVLVAQENDIKTLKEAKKIAERYVFEMTNAFKEE